MKVFIIVCMLACPLMVGAQVNAAASESLALYQDIGYSLRSGKPRQAIHYFDRVIRVCAEEGRENELPEKYFGMALGLAINGHYRQSIRYHKKAIKAHRKFRNDEPLEISINLGLTYYLAGKDKKARRILGDSI